MTREIGRSRSDPSFLPSTGRAGADPSFLPSAGRPAGIIVRVCLSALLLALCAYAVPGLGIWAYAAPDSPSAPAVPSRYSPSLLGAYRKSMVIEQEVRKACETHGLPVALARAVCMYESGGDDGLVSGAGARGYFQVMPATLRMMKVSTNIEAGVKYLAQLLGGYGREDDTLAAYNGGPRRLGSGRSLPIETLQYVVGVGTFRTLLTREETEIRADASRLDLYSVVPGDTWQSIADATGIPRVELYLYNPYLALRPLRAGSLVAHPRQRGEPLLQPLPGDGSRLLYTTRRGDNPLLLAFALDLDLDGFRMENSLWRVQVPFEGMRLGITPRPAPRPFEQLAAVARPGSATRTPPPRSSGSRSPVSR